jgi:hypothetical protein
MTKEMIDKIDKLVMPICCIIVVLLIIVIDLLQYKRITSLVSWTLGGFLIGYFLAKLRRTK